MDQGTALAAVRFLKERLEERSIQVSRLLLFGSYAIGTAGEESDLDILIVSKNFSGLNVFERSELLGDAEIETIRRFRVPIDLIFMSPEEFDNENSLMAQAARSDGIEA